MEADGLARRGRSGEEWTGGAWIGVEWQESIGRERIAQARQERSGTASLGEEWQEGPGMARPGVEWCGGARQDWTGGQWNRQAWYVKAGHGRTGGHRRCKVAIGAAGVERRGEVRLEAVKRGTAGN